MKLYVLFTLVALLSIQNAFATGDYTAPENYPAWFSWNEETKTLNLNGNGNFGYDNPNNRITKGQECVYDLSYHSNPNGSCSVEMKTVSMSDQPLPPWRSHYQSTQGGGGQLNLAGKILLFPFYLTYAAYEESSCFYDRLKFESMLNTLQLKCEAEDLAKAERVLEEHPYDQETLDIWKESKRAYDIPYSNQDRGFWH